MFSFMSSEVMLFVFAFQQPALCTFGKDGEILVVDSVRKVIAVFDQNGLYIRDIGKPGMH